MKAAPSERQTTPKPDEVLHEMYCSVCGRLDTPEKWMRHIYALRGTTPEREIKETDEAAKEIARRIIEFTEGIQP